MKNFLTLQWTLSPDMRREIKKKLEEIKCLFLLKILLNPIKPGENHFYPRLGKLLLAQKRQTLKKKLCNFQYIFI